MHTRYSRKSTPQSWITDGKAGWGLNQRPLEDQYILTTTTTCKRECPDMRYCLYLPVFKRTTEVVSFQSVVLGCIFVYLNTSCLLQASPKQHYPRRYCDF